jgi:hypothetical protein
MFTKLTAKLGGVYAKWDANFDEIAADPICRRDKIAALSAARTFCMFYAAISLVIFLLFSIAALLSYSGGKSIPTSDYLYTALWAFFAASSYVEALYRQSELRLLRVIERLQKDREEKPTA